MVFLRLRVGLWPRNNWLAFGRVQISRDPTEDELVDVYWRNVYSLVVFFFKLLIIFVAWGKRWTTLTLNHVSNENISAAITSLWFWHRYTSFPTYLLFKQIDVFHIIYQTLASLISARLSTCIYTIHYVPKMSLLCPATCDILETLWGTMQKVFWQSCAMYIRM